MKFKFLKEPWVYRGKIESVVVNGRSVTGPDVLVQDLPRKIPPPERKSEKREICDVADKQPARQRGRATTATAAAAVAAHAQPTAEPRPTAAAAPE